MPTDRQSVMVATPLWGVSPPEAIESRNRMNFHLGAWQEHADCPYNFWLMVSPDMAVQFTREAICKAAVEKGCAWVVMIDDDMLVPHDMVDRLLANDVDICAPLAFTRNRPINPVCYAARGGFVPGATAFIKNHQTIYNYPKDTLFECDAVGFGAVAIKTDVLKRLDPPWFYKMSGSNNSGEDIFFCHEARQKAGARVFMDSRIKLKHLSPRQYHGEEEYERDRPEVNAVREQLGDWSRDKSLINLAG